MARRVTKTKTAKLSKSESITAPEKTTQQPTFIQKKRTSLIVGALVVLILLGLLYYYRGLFVAAIVNGEPISRVSVVKDLEKQGGRQVLTSHVTKLLILQEAKKKNISVSQSEIDSEIKKLDDNLKAQKQSLDQALMLRGMTKDELVDQIRMQKIIEKLVGNDISVSDKEIADYIEKNKDALGAETDQKKLQNQTKEQIKQQKLSTKFQTWIADIQKNAKITYFVNY